MVCMGIIIPQMKSFYTNCLMGFPLEECRIYDIAYMWPILVIQSCLCTVMIIIKTIMIRKTYRLYILFHEFRSPLLTFIKSEVHTKIELPVLCVSLCNVEKSIQLREMMLTIPFTMEESNVCSTYLMQRNCMQVEDSMTFHTLYKLPL